MRRIRLDRIDRRILQELQADGRMTNVELAKRVGITAPPCLRRVRALEEAGLRRNCKHRASLSCAHFDDEPSVRREQLRSSRKDGPIGVKAVDPAVERKARIKTPYLARKSLDIGRRNIRGVRDDETERADHAVRP